MPASDQLDLRKMPFPGRFPACGMAQPGQEKLAAAGVWEGHYSE